MQNINKHQVFINKILVNKNQNYSQIMDKSVF